MEQGDRIGPGQIWRYEVVERRLHTPELGAYVAYGLRTLTREGEVELSDVSPDRRFVEQLAELFNERQLEPVHLTEAVQNFLAYPDQVEKTLAN